MVKCKYVQQEGGRCKETGETCFNMNMDYVKGCRIRKKLGLQEIYEENQEGLKTPFNPLGNKLLEALAK